MAINDMNRDPVSGAPGSHPVGVSVGGAGGAVAGAILGSAFGPIGTLVGGTVGTVAGAAAGKDVAERVDPTGETEFWRTEYAARPYYDRSYDYQDYGPAYRYGNELRNSPEAREWNPSMESRAREGWDRVKAESRLGWDKAKDAVRDAYDRSDRTYRAYDAMDRQYENAYAGMDYYVPEHDYSDYRPAYHYGAYAYSNSADRPWDSSVEHELERGWERARGNSRLAWNEAKYAVRDAWNDSGRGLSGYREKQP